MILPSRTDAGRRLAAALVDCAAHSPIVLALTPGGIRVGYEIAMALGAPLDVLAVGRLGVPGRPHSTFGAFAEGDSVLDEAAVTRLGLPRSYLASIADLQQASARRRASEYRGREVPLDPARRTAILADDGLTESVVLLAAIESLRKRGAARVIMAAPGLTGRAEQECAQKVDRLVVLGAAAPSSKLICDENFAQTTGGDVHALIEHTRKRAARAGASADRTRPGLEALASR